MRVYVFLIIGFSQYNLVCIVCKNALILGQLEKNVCVVIIIRMGTQQMQGELN